MESPFAWLESIAPPLLVLSTAYVLKEQLLESIEHRHATEQTYQMALNEWHKATAHPESHPQWSQFHANALRDMLTKANNRRQETLAALTTADWHALVYREFQTEHWYATPGEDYIPVRTMQEMEPVPLSLYRYCPNEMGTAYTPAQALFSLWDYAAGAVSDKRETPSVLQ